MMYTHDIRNAFEETIGNTGAGKKEFTADVEVARKAITVLRKHQQDNTLPILNVGERKDDLVLIEKAAQRISNSCDTLVVLGMGGSGRGGNTLVSLVKNTFTGIAGKTKIHFVENIDPHTFDQLLSSITLKNTIFLAISKSGSTAETLAQVLVLIKEVETKVGKDSIADHFVFITEPHDNAMRRLGTEYNIPMLEHDPNIGGRFAALTAVGLLPAKVAGLDIHAIRYSASEVVKHTLADADSEPAKGAALHNTMLKKGRTVSVLMPYCDRLDALGAWHQQLWEESLGKDRLGTVLLRALGATDQHSQLQLYLDGPHDKFITLILLEQKKAGKLIPAAKDKSLAYLNNHTIGGLMEAEQRATAETLTLNKCPLRVFNLKTLDEKSVGALMMHFMLETMITAHLWNINAFDQPAVEQGKKLAREYLLNAA